MEDNLAKDFVALWQSELTAMAADRELRESWTGMVALWANATAATLRMMQTTRYDSAPGSPRALEPTRPAPAALAFEPGLAEVEQLNQRIAELEQRLAEFLRDRDGHAARS